MGLLKSLVKDAVADGVRKGIGKAVGQAVGEAIKPSVEKMAQESADLINSATKSIDQGTAEISTAAAEADQKIKAAGGFGALESALGGLTSRAERYATEMSKNMKICPSCGEACSADKSFCPKCGAKLPEETLADWAAKCPGYPEWNVGGTCFELVDCGPRNGHDSYSLSFEGNRDVVNRYVSLLRSNGFTAKCAETYYKEVGGICRAFDIGETGAADSMLVHFYVGNYCRKPEPPKPQDDPLSSLAKGLLKKIKF